MKSIKNIYHIGLRELKTYITAPMTYIIMAALFLIANMLFLTTLERFDEACKRASVEMIPSILNSLDINFYVLSPQNLNIAFLCIFFLPIFTMKLVADEKKNHTIELLMTSPITSLEIILGKFWAMSVVWIIILGLTFMYPLAISRLPLIQIDWAYYLSGLLGLFLYGLFGIAIGLFASSLTDNLLIASVVGFFTMGLLYFLINIAVISDTPLGRLAYTLSSFPHLNEFLKGIIDTKNIAYFLLGTGFMLFVSERILESQRVAINNENCT